MHPKKVRDISAVAVRMPPAFRERIEELATENRRSLNAEILFHLQQTIFDPIGTKKADARS